MKAPQTLRSSCYWTEHKRQIVCFGFQAGKRKKKRNRPSLTFRVKNYFSVWHFLALMNFFGMSLISSLAFSQLASGLVNATPCYREFLLPFRVQKRKKEVLLRFASSCFMHSIDTS